MLGVVINIDCFSVSICYLILSGYDMQCSLYNTVYLYNIILLLEFFFFVNTVPRRAAPLLGVRPTWPRLLAPRHLRVGIRGPQSAIISNKKPWKHRSQCLIRATTTSLHNYPSSD